MLVDGAIRNRVVVLGDAIQDDVEVALAQVVRGASMRRRREMATGIAMIAVLVASMSGVWFSSVSTERQGGERQRPVQDTTEWDERDRQLRQRLRFQDDRFGGAGESNGRSGGGPKLPRRGDPRRTTPNSASTSADPARREPKSDGTTGDAEMRSSGIPSAGDLSRDERAPYQMPVIRPRIDSRQSCSVFGEGCVGFDTRPEEEFVQVTVADDSGEPVLVRITQWDRHGTVVGDPTLYCGGVSRKVEILPMTDHVMVEIDDRNCPDGRQSRPLGGVVDFAFFHG